MISTNEFNTKLDNFLKGRQNRFSHVYILQSALSVLSEAKRVLGVARARLIDRPDIIIDLDRKLNQISSKFPINRKSANKEFNSDSLKLAG